MAEEIEIIGVKKFNKMYRLFFLKRILLLWSFDFNLLLLNEVNKLNTLGVM